jgi:putative hydrolase of the HAD superfamily
MALTLAAGGGPADGRDLPRGVLFDMDDTLYPEHEFVDGGFAAVATWLAPRLGVPADELRARLWTLHGRDGRGRLFDTLLEEHAAGPDPDLVRACLLLYRTHTPRLRPFRGVPALLESLQAGGVRLGIVSDGTPAVQHRKLAGLGGIAGRFEVVVMTGELGPDAAKPSPIPFRVACRLLDLVPADVVYVGNDPRKDFAGARDAGLATVRVGRVPDEGGAAPAVAAVDAQQIIDDIAGLTAALRARAVRGAEAR